MLALSLILGCGGTEGSNPGAISVSEDLAKSAYRLARDGKAGELRALLAEHPRLANALVSRGTPLLEIVVDIRPAFPAMHQTIEVLLQAGADPNLDAPEILRKAIWRGDPESLELLLKYGANPLVQSQKKKMNMLDYARSKDDQRFLRIIEAWEAHNRLD